MANLGRFAEGRHNAAPMLIVPAVPAMMNIGEDMSAFVQQCRVAVAFAPGDQKPAIENNSALVAVGDAGLGLGTTTGLHRGVKAGLIGGPHFGGPS